MTTALPFFQVDAFASGPFTGNPAAVMPLNEWLPDHVMQAIACRDLRDLHLLQHQVPFNRMPQVRRVGEIFLQRLRRDSQPSSGQLHNCSHGSGFESERRRNSDNSLASGNRDLHTSSVVGNYDQ